VLPLMVPLAILTGWGLEGAIGREGDGESAHGLLSRWLLGALVTHLSLLAAALGVGLIRPESLSQTPQSLWLMLIVPAVALQAAGVLLGGTARCRAALVTVVAALMWMYAVGLIGLVPQLGQSYSSGALVPQIAANSGPGTRLMSYKYLPTALVYYLDRRVEQYRDTRALRRAMSSAESFLLVLPANHLKSVQEETGFVLKVIAASGSGRKRHVVAAPAAADRLKLGDSPVE